MQVDVYKKHVPGGAMNMAFLVFKYQHWLIFLIVFQQFLSKLIFAFFLFTTFYFNTLFHIFLLKIQNSFDSSFFTFRPRNKKAFLFHYPFGRLNHVLSL